MTVKTPPGIKQEPPDDATIVTPRVCNLPMGDHHHINNGASLPGGATAVTMNIPQLNLAGSTLQLPTQIYPDGLSPRKKPRKQQL